MSSSYHPLSYYFDYLMLYDVKYYPVFLQNFWTPNSSFFAISWSLSVEEWFYLLFPLSLLPLLTLLRNKLSKRHIIIISILTLIVIPVLLRLSRAFDIGDDMNSKEIMIDHIVLMRLDSIMYGVLAAYGKYYYHDLWIKLRYLLFVAGIAALSVCLYVSVAYKIDFFVKTFLLTGLGLSLSALLPWSDGIKKGPRYISEIVTHVSVISYSLYLIHILFLDAIINTLRILNIPTQYMYGYPQYGLYLAAILMLSTLVYKYYEKPMTNLRDRFT